MGEIDYDELGRRLAANRGRPAIINVNIGTTVKGAVDNLDRVLRVLRCKGYEREDFHIHCDGALFAMMLPFVDFAPEVRRHRERIEHRQGATSAAASAVCSAGWRCHTASAAVDPGGAHHQTRPESETAVRPDWRE